MRGLAPGFPYSCSFALGTDTPDPTKVTASVVHTGSVDPAFAVTVSQPAPGVYWLSGKVPQNYQPGDEVGVYVTYQSVVGSMVVNVDFFMVEDNREYEIRNAADKNFLAVRKTIAAMS